MRVGFNKMEVRAIFKRYMVGEVQQSPLIDYIAEAVGNVIEENNKKLWENLQEASKKTQ
jgi:hypothetical protein